MVREKNKPYDMTTIDVYKGGYVILNTQGSKNNQGQYNIATFEALEKINFDLTFSQDENGTVEQNPVTRLCYTNDQGKTCSNCGPPRVDVDLGTESKHNFKCVKGTELSNQIAIGAETIADQLNPMTDAEAICYANRYQDLKNAYGYNVKDLKSHWNETRVSNNEKRTKSCNGVSRFIDWNNKL
tara:strand:+ start:1302 stop:1853 length:552 start_codon:yes stop_codon:yes gene_type:complete